MSPTPEGTARAKKAWETIRRKTSGNNTPRNEASRTETPRNDVKKKRSGSTATKVSDYPENWKQIVAEILNRAQNELGEEQCECHGECLKHHGRCEEINHTWPKHRRHKGKVKIRLTTAHLCHTPKCDERSHLRAMCEPCHLIYDLRCRQQSLRGDQAVEWAVQQGKKSTNA
jgi:hypothetical protein